MRTRKKVLITACIAVSVFAITLILWGPVIFQRGNPVPYLLAASKITDTQPFVQVKVNDISENVYIASRGECPELFDYIEAEYNLEYTEQMGSAYVFTTDNSYELIVESEIYWSKYTVWDVPNKTLPDS